MSLDEFLFGKIARYFKDRKKAAAHVQDRTVQLADIKNRLTLLARSLTGQAIEIFPAEREGGYKGNNFFLPTTFSHFSTVEENLSFYFFRIFYLSEQKNNALNWFNTQSLDTLIAQQIAAENAPTILQQLQNNFPLVHELYELLLAKWYLQTTNPKQLPDLSWWYGKVMQDEKTTDKAHDALKNFTDKVKTASIQPKTTLKAKAVEEIRSIIVDTKQQEDYVFTHNFEKVETAEEFSGSWRDFDGDDELESHQNALDELNLNLTVRVDDTVHSVYQSDFIENSTVAESEENEATPICWQYDEWDYRSKSYRRDYCKLYAQQQTAKDIAYYQQSLRDYAVVLSGLRKMLTSVNNKWQQQRRQTQGQELDMDSVVDYYTDLKNRTTPSEKIYVSPRKKEKDLAILLLLDISLSSDGYVAGNRIIDIEKQAALLFGEILNEYAIDFSIHCFYSKTRNYASYMTLKAFDEKWEQARYKVGAAQPLGYTRIGVALRHSYRLIQERQAKNKWIIILSDGKPNDFDKYEGKYGIEDVKQVLREMHERRINSYALAIESDAKYYLPQMFGNNHYQILGSPNELLGALVKLYERIKMQS
ncbi:MAG: VWA domain-containing protein [Chitinophagales bacterium]|nr:VWA domain-containing protein [Chitinophagales bacterium]